MILRNGKSWAERLGLDNPASALDEAAQLGQVLDLLSGTAAVGHTHLAAQVTDLAAALVGIHETDGHSDSDSLTWAADGNGAMQGSIRLATNSGLTLGAGGLSVDFGSGTGQVPTADHTHANDHAAASLTSTNTLDITPADQTFTLEARLDTTTGGLVASTDGLALDFGTGSTQAARGNHTHANDHAAATVLSTQSITLGLYGQQITAYVNRDPTPDANNGLINQGARGLAVALGSTADKAAAGNHVHAVATTANAGFMAASDKIALALYGQLIDLDQSVTFTRHARCEEGQYIGGRHRWGQAMSLRAAHLTSLAPDSDCTVSIEVDGSAVETITIPGGVAHSEVTNDKTVSGVAIPADTFVRCKLTSGMALLQEAPYQIDVTLTVRPAFADSLVYRIDCGSDVGVDPFTADSFYETGYGVSYTTESSINLSGVLDPAPEAVYQTVRAVLGSTAHMVYVLPGLLRGLDYKVRLHFAEVYFTATQDSVFDLTVTGATTVTESNFCIYDAAGGANKAYIWEATLAPDASGEITIRLVPQLGNNDGYNSSLAAVEVAPA